MSIHQLSEPPCDSVPDWIDDYGFQFRDSGFVYDIVQNPNDPNQFAYTRVYPSNEYGIYSTFKVFITDLSTRKTEVIDSLFEFHYLDWGGDYLVYDNWGLTKLYNTKTGSSTILDGRRPFISTNGEWLKLYYRDRQHKEDLIDLESDNVIQTWKREEPGAIVWLENERFVYSQALDTNPDSVEIREFSTTDLRTKVLMKLSFDLRQGHPSCLLNDHSFISHQGQVTDFKNQTLTNYAEHCESKHFDGFINLKEQRKLLGFKDYYETDHDRQIVVYYREFHIMNYDGSNEERVQLNF